MGFLPLQRRAIHQKPEQETIDHALTGINEASPVFAEVIKRLVAASPSVIEQKAPRLLFSEMSWVGGVSLGKEFQGSAPASTACYSM